MLEIHSSMLRFFLIAVAVCIIAIFAMPLSVRIINFGNLIGMLAGFLLLGFAIWNRPISKLIRTIWNHHAGKIALSAVGIILLCGLTLCLVLSMMMTAAMKRKPQSEPQAIIVLGCKVRDGAPSRMLRKRLETAYTAMQQYPDMICVVSGGKGSDEVISEAQCMFEWLTEKGIPAERIIMEDCSTSTSENLAFSKKLLDRRTCSEEILLATDGYHQMRAQLLAKKEGFTNVSAVSADTQLGLLPTYWVREWFGIVHAAVFGN